MLPEALHAPIAAINSLDWDDLPAVGAASDKLLTTLDHDRTLLTALTARTAGDPALADLCEHYDILDKIVLHDDPTGWRLRLHVFLPGYYDRPHNHRWTYSSRILAGSYTHTLYDLDTPPDDNEHDQELDIATGLRTRMIRTETAGDTYTLHHHLIHSVVAEPYTTTLIVRGPAVKDRFFLTDNATGRSWWQYGAATETPEEAAAKRLRPNELRDRLDHLTESGVLA
jgi:hypothetical protein